MKFKIILVCLMSLVSASAGAMPIPAPHTPRPTPTLKRLSDADIHFYSSCIKACQSKVGAWACIKATCKIKH